jgi:hypothetical protein
VALPACTQRAGGRGKPGRRQEAGRAAEAARAPRRARALMRQGNLRKTQGGLLPAPASCAGRGARSAGMSRLVKPLMHSRSKAATTVSGTSCFTTSPNLGKTSTRCRAPTIMSITMRRAHASRGSADQARGRAPSARPPQGRQEAGRAVARFCGGSTPGAHGRLQACGDHVAVRRTRGAEGVRPADLHGGARGHGPA